MGKTVVACLTSEDLPVIQRIASDREHEVVAVALDLGSGAPLRELHDAARAAGAVRCHALDVREEFARECVLPALEAATVEEASAELQTRTREFVARTVASIASLEGDAAVIARPHRVTSALTRAAQAAPHRAAHVDVTFDDRVPVALNGIPMTLAQVLDTLGTIGAVHGIERDVAALSALHCAYQAFLAEHAAGSGAARLLFANRLISAVQPDYATT